MESLRNISDKIRMLVRESISKSERELSIQEIEHIPNQKVFKNKFLYRSQPIIIRGFQNKFGLPKFNSSILANIFGDTKLSVRVNDYSLGLKEFDRIEMTIKEYINNQNKSYNYPPYAGYQEFQSPMSNYISFPNWLKPNYNDEPIHYWLGYKDVFTAYHSDINDKLIYQSFGTKKWWVTAPLNFESLYLLPDFGKGYDVSEINPESPDLIKYPQYEQITVSQFNLEPGDLLFLPGCWYHSVKSLDLSLSFEFGSEEVPASISHEIKQSLQKQIDNIIKKY
jgi:hypothetical protein